ncbi:MAG TPA: multicopper oxidase [Anaerolineae bacterium]|nr:multicopper oxidase [Anaerolineae bacterium]
MIPKYQMSLIIPPAMPRTAQLPASGANTANAPDVIDYYEIAVRQFRQQILPTGMPQTTVWSYGSANHPNSFNYPAFTIEAGHNHPVRVKWINDLKDPNTGRFLPHILPVDQTLHWANPPGPRDHHGTSQDPYMGPVPIVTHVHGAHTGDESDGYTEAWYLPAANNIPSDYFAEGTWYRYFRRKFQSQSGVAWEDGTATFQYPNDQRATTMWYHDHTLGMTRVNVYAGPAGFYLLRGGPDDVVGGVLPGPAPALGDPANLTYYEIPLAIQDRSFNQDGSLFYPDNRAFFEGLEPEQLQIPFMPEYACDGHSDIAPMWNPEFFGNTIVVNGRTWPFLNVERRRYRFRFLNGCNSRFLILKFENELPLWQIGSEGGFLPAPVQLGQLLMAPAERADVIVDFSNLPVGATLILRNYGPDEPFGGGVPGVDFEIADPATTGQVMQFRVVAASGPDPSTPPHLLQLPAITPLGPASLTRQVSLNEEDSATVFVEEENGVIELDCASDTPFGPAAALCGTLTTGGMGQPLLWMDPITENPALNATEVWEIYNFTMDAHPIHLHEVMFEVVNREMFDPMPHTPATPRPPEPWETGFKDTVIAYPGEITRIKAKFDLPGLYVWHCHIVEHEDNEMMRPYAVGPIPEPWVTKLHFPFAPHQD